MFEITEGAEVVVKKKTKGKFSIPKVEVQIKGAFIELEDLRNRSMWSILRFKTIHDENKLTWEDTARMLGQLISEEVDIN